MTKIVNFGSYCIDNVYQVPYFVKPGETLPCTDYQIHPGGKGLNQSLALAHAGTQVRHAGRVGNDGIWMKSILSEAGVDTSLTRVVDMASGHAIIQVTPGGENAIVIYGGANKTITLSEIQGVMDTLQPAEFLLIQNEINLASDLINLACAKEQRIVFNAAPITKEVISYPLDKVEIFILNEVEGEALTDETDPERILNSMLKKFPASKTVLTLGPKGAIYADKNIRVRQSAYEVTQVDATGAGDTFTGYFLADYVRGERIEKCLDIACKASALCVTKEGAASSIPKKEELDSVNLKLSSSDRNQI